MNQNPFLANRSTGVRAPRQQQSNQQLPQTLGLGLDLPRVMAQVKQNQLRRQQMGEDAPQAHGHIPAPGRRNSCTGSSGLMSHMDEQRKSVLANILKAIKSVPEKSRRDSGESVAISVSQNSAFKRLQPSGEARPAEPPIRQVELRPSATRLEDMTTESIPQVQAQPAEKSGATNARAETVRSLHAILQKMVATNQAQQMQKSDDANNQTDNVPAMLAQSGLSADVLTMLLLKANDLAEAPEEPKVPILNPIKAIKSSLLRQIPATSDGGQERELTQMFKKTPPLFARVAPSSMLSGAKVSQTPQMFGIHGTSRFMSNRERTMSGNMLNEAPQISDASMGVSVSEAPRARSTELMSQAERSEERADRSNSNHFSMESIGSSETGRPLTIEEKRQRILRHWERKRARQQSKKEVRYHCRKDLADKRFRYRGRFISQEQKAKILAEDSGAFDIYDPNQKCTPRSKQIFKVERHRRSTSSCSSDCPSRRKSEESKESSQQAIPVQPMNLFTGAPGIEAPTMAAGVHSGSLFAGRPSSGLFGKIGNLGQQLVQQPTMMQTNIGVLTEEQMSGQPRLFPQQPLAQLNPIVESNVPNDEDMIMHNENHRLSPEYY